MVSGAGWHAVPQARSMGWVLIASLRRRQLALLRTDGPGYGIVFDHAAVSPDSNPSAKRKLAKRCPWMLL